MSKPEFAYLPEDPSHDQAIEIINEEAFGPGRFTRAAERVREQGPHDRSLSFVCVDGGETIASVRMTPIDAGATPAHLLGPLAVRPSHKNLGVGRALVRMALEAARQAGSEAVILVGDPPYYQPLGFAPTRPGALKLPGPVDPRRVLAATFDGLDPQSLEGVIAHRNMRRPEPAV